MRSSAPRSSTGSAPPTSPTPSCTRSRRRFGARTMLVVPHLRRTGPTYGLLVSRAMATGRVWEALSPYARAVLRAGEEADSVLRARRLAHTPEQAGAQAPASRGGRRSLELPDRPKRPTKSAPRPSSFWCWKAAAGRAAGAPRSCPACGDGDLRPHHAADLRAKRASAGSTVSNSTAAPIAMAIMLSGQRRAYCWKISFDEAFALYSPGVQLMIEVTRRQLADPDMLLTDSCADRGRPDDRAPVDGPAGHGRSRARGAAGRAAQGALGRERIAPPAAGLGETDRRHRSRTSARALRRPADAPMSKG